MHRILNASKSSILSALQAAPGDDKSKKKPSTMHGQHHANVVFDFGGPIGLPIVGGAAIFSRRI